MPIRCFSCGFPIAAFVEDYRKGIEKGKSAEDILNKLGIKRYCCRRIFISNVELIEDIAPEISVRVTLRIVAFVLVLILITSLISSFFSIRQLRKIYPLEAFA